VSSDVVSKPHNTRGCLVQAGLVATCACASQQRGVCICICTIIIVIIVIDPS
jgi:hypothetical protein